MSLHLHANYLTSFGVASNNRGEKDGNLNTLQKVLFGDSHRTTVSAEAIRFALRESFRDLSNRVFDHNQRKNTWRDENRDNGDYYIDDDVLGYMDASAAKIDDSTPDVAPRSGKTQRKGKGKNTTVTRTSPLGISRAVSLTPWLGDIDFHAAAVGASSGAQTGQNSAIYSVEVHNTAYQYFATLTPDALLADATTTPNRVSVVELVFKGLNSLNRVGGCHASYSFDFSPKHVVYRITEDPAPRIGDCFDFTMTPDGRPCVLFDQLLYMIENGTLPIDELVIGTDVAACGSMCAKAGIPCTGTQKALEVFLGKVREKTGKDGI